MSQPELLKHLIAVLEAAGIPYMVTGSTVSSLQGNPRSTHDIDVVVAIRTSMVASLMKAFPSPRFYLEEESVRDAIKTGGMFNSVDSPPPATPTASPATWTAA